MSKILSKIGTQINAPTYEYYCDTMADKDKIDPRQITLGSTCVVIEGASGGIEGYIANSNKEWILLGSFGGNSSNSEEPIVDNSITIQSMDVLSALMNSNDNLSVKLNDNLTLSNTFSIPEGKEVKINLNNKNITTSTTLFDVNGGTLILEGNGIVNAGGNIAYAYNGGKVVVNGGTYDSTADNFGIGALGNDSIIEFNGGELSTTEGGIMAFDGGEIVMNGGTIHTRDNFAIGTNGSDGRGGNTITMNGGTIDAHITSNGYEAIGIYLPNDDTFVMNGGEINVVEGAGIVQRGGSCTINDGTITVTGAAGKTGWVGDNKTKMSESAIIYHQSANYPAVDTIQLTINGGTFTGLDHSLEVLTNEENPRITITGGTFNPAYPEE